MKIYFAGNISIASEKVAIGFKAGRLFSFFYAEELLNFLNLKKDLYANNERFLYKDGSKRSP